ncbi:MAG: hypothetical protein OJI67_13940 [Prosthecobacter sp.]|nr:hypothetical protein [Prosthecobacter sp.]
MATLSQHQIYVFATSFMAAFFVAAMVRLWLLRRVEEKLLKNKDALEKQIVLQQKDLMTVRKESNDWRMEMQRQFDLFRHMASDQLGVEEKRFNDLLAKSTRREYELQTALDLAKQMCAELPSAKARVLHLESLLDSSTVPTAPAAPESDSGSDSDGGLTVTPVTPMPDLSGGGAPAPAPEPEPVEEEIVEIVATPAPVAPPAPIFPPKISIPSPLSAVVAPAVAAFTAAPLPPPTESPTPLVDEIKLTELEQKLAEAEKKNASLQLALTTTRLRSRSKTKNARKYAMKKRELVRA